MKLIYIIIIFDTAGRFFYENLCTAFLPAMIICVDVNLSVKITVEFFELPVGLYIKF